MRVYTCESPNFVSPNPTFERRLFMTFSSYYAWAGTVLLLLELFHFCRQRKLYDHRTLLFLLMLCSSLCICAGGIGQTMQIAAGRVADPATLGLAVITYFAQLTMPYLLLRMVFRIARNPHQLCVKIGTWLFAAGSLIVFSNPWTELISYPGGDGLLHAGKWYDFFVWGLLGCYLVDLCILLFLKSAAKRGHRLALVEVCLLLTCGMLLQNIFHIQLAVGFTAALAMAILYFTMQSSYAYIDFTTHVFNADYFNYLIWERFSDKKTTFLLVVKLNSLERIRTIYGDDTEVDQQITENLWKISPGHKVFRLRSGKYAVLSDTAEEHQHIIQKTLTFSHEIHISDHALHCPMILTGIEHLETVCQGSISMLMNYVHFLLSQACQQNTIQFISDTPQQRELFYYERNVEQYLNAAIENDRFEIWYQLIWSIPEHKFIGMEALSRLHHPELGWINPELFIRLAVKNGQIFTIMPQQLHKICRFLQEHSAELQDIRNVKINLSTVELTKEGYCEQLIEIIRSYDLPMERFQFEITETDATEYTRELEHCIQLLQKNNIQLCLDDFGSGYANLSSILRLPFDIIKMDRSLLQDICENKISAAFYHSMIDTLHKIGYQIVSEGVETAQEADLLTRWNVDMIQGYYYARPQSAADILITCKEQSHCSPVQHCQQ